MILVTGVNGFVGHHVAKQLHEAGYRVLGVSNQPDLAPDLSEAVSEYVSCDLTDPGSVGKIDLSKVGAIINLAGFAQVGASRGQGDIYNKVNIGVHATLYQECLNQKVSPRIIAVSTGAVYDPNQEMPITEESALVSQDKTNEYVISKQNMERELDKFREKGLRIIVARPFNHSGPGQLPGFLLPDLGEQLKNAKEQNQALLVGNLKTKRDYTDVRDVADAYILLATTDQANLRHETYNICSGKSIEGHEILKMLAEAFEIKDVEIKIDQDRIRPNDVMDIYGSSQRLVDDTGWQPKISPSKMIQDYANWKLNTN